MDAARDAQPTIGRARRAFVLPADQLSGFIDALLELAAGDPVVVQRHITGLDRVHAQQLDYVYAELVGRHVPGLLDGPIRGRAPKATKSAGGNQVRVDKRRIGAHGGVPVERVGSHARGAHYRDRFGGVGAIVGQDLDVLGLHVPVAVYTEADPIAHRHARPAAGQELLLARVDELHRTASLAGQQR